MIRFLPSQAVADPANRQSSPKPRFASVVAKAVPVEKVSILEWVSGLNGAPTGGNKGLLTMFARQLFPSWRAKERFH
jgi:hypothetical protein